MLRIYKMTEAQIEALSKACSVDTRESHMAGWQVLADEMGFHVNTTAPVSEAFDPCYFTALSLETPLGEHSGQTPPYIGQPEEVVEGQTKEA